MPKLKNIIFVPCTKIANCVFSSCLFKLFAFLWFTVLFCDLHIHECAQLLIKLYVFHVFTTPSQFSFHTK